MSVGNRCECDFKRPVLIDDLIAAALLAVMGIQGVVGSPCTLFFGTFVLQKPRPTSGVVQSNVRSRPTRHPRRWALVHAERLHDGCL